MFQSYRANQTAGQGNALNQMNHDAMDYSFIERNQNHLQVILNIELFCAKQDISLRGHRENVQFKFRCKYDSRIPNHLEQLPRNVNLMNPDVQNELLESATSLLLCKIKALKPGTYYALMERMRQSANSWL